MSRDVLARERTFGMGITLVVLSRCSVEASIPNRFRSLLVFPYKRVRRGSQWPARSWTE